MLIEEDHVAVGVGEGEAGGACGGLVGGCCEGEASFLREALEGADVVEVGEGVAVRVPAWIEGEDVLVEHALEEADGGGAVAHDHEALFLAAHDGLEAEFLVEGF